MKKVFF